VNQNLNAGRVEWPTGPLGPFPHTEATWLEAWVVQGENGGTGASQRTVQTSFAVPGRWTADGIPPGHIQGSFQPGPALGIALVTWHDAATNTDKFRWWIDAINLS
jgi:hypothetical protein